MKIVILGARLDGQAGVALNAIRTIGDHEVVAFLDNTSELQGVVREGVPVIGRTDNLAEFVFPPGVEGAFVAIGENYARQRLARIIQDRGLTLINVLHPSANIDPTVTLGGGIFVGPGAVICKGASIGDAVIVNSGAVIDHDCVIEDAVHVGPGSRLAGRVKVRERAFLGTGTTAIPDVVIGEDSILGAGSVVVDNVTENAVSLGVPARLKHHREPLLHRRAGETPYFNEPVPLSKPTLPAFAKVADEFQNVFTSGMLSNFARYEKELGDRTKEYFQVRHSLPTPSCTTGLMMTIRELGLKGKAIVPSFTFFSTVHSMVWGGLEPIFADIDRETFTLDPEEIARRATPDTSAVIAVHVFGNPCEIEGLQRACHERNLTLIFDAAHGFGSRYKGVPLGGFGDVEVFSLSGTKVVTSGEGGLVATNDDELAKRIEQSRNYGNRGDYDAEIIGMNGKMSELNAVLGLASMKQVDSMVSRRNELASRYEDQLRSTPGISFQKVHPDNTSNYTHFAIVVDPDEAGIDRNDLATVLAENNVMTRKYFSPPVHRLAVYSRAAEKSEVHLPNTDYVSERVLSLPLWSHMPDDVVSGICETIQQACVH